MQCILYLVCVCCPAQRSIIYPPGDWHFPWVLHAEESMHRPFPGRVYILPTCSLSWYRFALLCIFRRRWTPSAEKSTDPFWEECYLLASDVNWYWFPFRHNDRVNSPGDWLCPWILLYAAKATAPFREGYITHMLAISISICSAARQSSIFRRRWTPSVSLAEELRSSAEKSTDSFREECYRYAQCYLVSIWYHAQRSSTFCLRLTLSVNSTEKSSNPLPSRKIDRPFPKRVCYIDFISRTIKERVYILYRRLTLSVNSTENRPTPPETSVCRNAHSMAISICSPAPQSSIFCRRWTLSVNSAQKSTDPFRAECITGHSLVGVDLLSSSNNQRVPPEIDSFRQLRREIEWPLSRRVCSLVLCFDLLCRTTMEHTPAESDPLHQLRRKIHRSFRDECITVYIYIYILACWCRFAVLHSFREIRGGIVGPLQKRGDSLSVNPCRPELDRPLPWRIYIRRQCI